MKHLWVNYRQAVTKVMRLDKDYVMLEILFQDSYLLAINKPPGLLVHRSPIAKDADEFAVQMLRDQIGQHVYPAHRLDRKTSGVLLFSLDEQTHRLTQHCLLPNPLPKPT